MLNLNDFKFKVLKDDKRIDDHILSIDFHNSQIAYTDKKGIVHYEIYPNDVQVEVEEK